MRKRLFPEHDYKAVFLPTGKTFRFGQNITELSYPEFYDVAINDWCAGGCTYCYVAAKETGKHYNNVLDKINKFFGTMTLNQRPFQVALGGEGEPTAHPEFINVLKTFYDLQIVPNYTSNGMHLNDEILDATLKYSGGVAVSIHPHLKPHWESAIEKYGEAKVRLNLHVVVSSKATIDFFWKLFDKYKDVVEYFVLLPYMSNREAPYKFVDTNHLEETLTNRREDLPKVAFGSNLYQFLIKDGNKYNASLYEPESMSKYAILRDDLGLYSDSHGMIPLSKEHVLWNHSY